MRQTFYCQRICFGIDLTENLKTRLTAGFHLVAPRGGVFCFAKSSVLRSPADACGCLDQRLLGSPPDFLAYAAALSGPTPPVVKPDQLKTPLKAVF